MVKLEAIFAVSKNADKTLIELPTEKRYNLEKTIFYYKN